MKKALSLLLTFVMIGSVLGVGVFAANGDTYSLSNASVTVDGTANQTVTVNLIATKAGTVYGFQGTWVTSAADGKIALSKLTPAATVSATENSASTGNVLWLDSSYSSGISVEAGGAIWSATFTVDKDTPSGEYPVTLDVSSIIKDSNKGDKGIGTLTGTVTVTNASGMSTSDEKPYSVALSADKTEVNIGDDVNVYLDVTNSDTSVTSFSSFYGKVTYDKDLVSYAGTSSTEVKESEFYIDNSTPGTLVIKRYGSSVNLSDAHELTLPFKANAKGDAGFTLVGVNDGEKVKIDVDSHAENNALEVKEVTGSPLTVTVKEAASDDPVVSVSLVDYVGSSEANTFKLIIASIDKTGYVPTYDGKKMYQVVGTGYDADKYYYVIPASETYESNKLGSEEGTATKLQKDNDINQSNLVDINDAQFVYNIYHGASPTTNVVERLLLADTSGDQRVETDDCVPIIKAI